MQVTTPFCYYFDAAMDCGHKKAKSPNFLRPKFKFKTQSIPNKYLGCGYMKAYFFFEEIMVELWKAWTRNLVPKWVGIVCPKILQMPQKISDQNVCPSPKVWDFWKRLFLGVCSPWLQASIFSKVSQDCRILFRSKIFKFKIIIQWLMSVTSWSFLLDGS